MALNNGRKENEKREKQEKGVKKKKVVNFAASLAGDGSVGVFGVTGNPCEAL